MTQLSLIHTVPPEHLSAQATLPDDWRRATLIGRVMTDEGPCVVYVDAEGEGELVDITHAYPATCDLFEREDPAAAAKEVAGTGKVLGRLSDVMDNSAARIAIKPYLLAPVDFQDVEAAGVTFVESMVERMIENAAVLEVPANVEGKRDSARLDAVRERIRAEVGDIVGEADFSRIVPGSPAALEILSRMQALGMSTIYPQVGLGAEGEIFSKAIPVTSVGHGAQAGYTTPRAGVVSWVNPEPEVVLVVNSSGVIVGASVGNDVNDREKEGQSPLLLHRAKVKNGSTAIGPFVRLFDEGFNLDSLRDAEIQLEVWRADGSLKFAGANKMGKISRAPEAIVAAATDSERQHPDGIAVFLGTMIVPLKDERGNDFTHEEGDVVRISSPKLGGLVNVMLPAEKVRGLEKGALDLARNLAGRGLLTPQAKA